MCKIRFADELMCKINISGIFYEYFSIYIKFEMELKNMFKKLKLQDMFVYLLFMYNLKM